MDRTAFDTVYTPKVLGAYLLHRHLQDEPLDHFVLFSSIASLLTTAGQTNYAAGNAFLDALAHHRRARGLPALSIDWGSLGHRHDRGAGSGRALPHPPGDELPLPRRGHGRPRTRHRPGPSPVACRHRRGLAGLPRLVSAAAAPGRRPGPRQRTRPTHRRPGTAVLPDTFRSVFRAADPDAREALLTDRFTHVIAGVLRMPAEQVDPATGLGALGLDSLLAMELRSRVQADLGVTLPVVALLGNTPVGDLVKPCPRGTHGAGRRGPGRGRDHGRGRGLRQPSDSTH
ncbi:hypothetical protein GCM10023238_08710 [Streptomyces heliomycini]